MTEDTGWQDRRKYSSIIAGETEALRKVIYVK
jgi:hypothetical protein